MTYAWLIASSWLPFIVYIALAVALSLALALWLRHRTENERQITFCVVFGLVIGCFALCMIPLDIYTVSYISKNAVNASFLPDGLQQVSAFQRYIMIAYYVVFGLTSFYIFLLAPFYYFYFEEKDETEHEALRGYSRCIGAAKFTVVFVLVAAVLLMIGALIPKAMLTTPSNSTDSIWGGIGVLVSDLATTPASDALWFVVSIEMGIGTLLMCAYTAAGLAAWPVTYIRGYRSLVAEREEVRQQRQTLQRSLQAERSGHNYSDRLDETLYSLERRQQLLDARFNNSCWRCSKRVWRPFQLLLGIGMLLFSWFIVIALLWANVSSILATNWGLVNWVQLLKIHLAGNASSHLFSTPVDTGLVWLQQFYPLDYVVFSLFVLYCFFATIYGLQRIGIWFCCLRMYRIRPHRTVPQALLCMVCCLLLVVQAFCLLFYQMAPVYLSFGNQMFAPNGSAEATEQCAFDYTLNTATDVFGHCYMTRISVLLGGLLFRTVVFNMFYYGTFWILLIVFLVKFFYCVFRRPLSSVEGYANLDEFESDSEEQLLNNRRVALN